MEMVWCFGSLEVTIYFFIPKDDPSFILVTFHFIFSPKAYSPKRKFQEEKKKKKTGLSNMEKER